MQKYGQRVHTRDDETGTKYTLGMHKQGQRCKEGGTKSTHKVKGAERKEQRWHTAYAKRNRLKDHTRNNKDIPKLKNKPNKLLSSLATIE